MMKNIVVIGQSPAAYAAVKNILDRDPSMGVTLISCDGQMPYDPALIPGLIDRSVRESDIFCAAVDFYKSAQVEVILDREISRVNVERRKIFLADPSAGAQKLSLGFDGLIITDTPHLKLPQLKGVRRQGVFHLMRLGVVKDLVRYLMNTETVIVEPLGFAGIKAALALKSVGKDVIVVVRQSALLADILAPERSQALVTALEKRGVRVLAEGAVEDIIGEAEVKAVRLRSGKVVACDMVVIEDLTPDMSFIAGTETAGSDSVPVTGPFAAAVRVARLFGEELPAPGSSEPLRDMLDTFFHPQELSPVTPEVTS